MKLNSHDIDTVGDLISFLELLTPTTLVRWPEKHEPLPNLGEGDYDDYAGLETGNLLKIEVSYYDEVAHIDRRP